MSRRLPIAIVIAGSVILAACGGGGDYEDSLREITEDQEEASVTFDESISESLPGIVADITFMRALIDELPALIESTNDGIAGLEELDPPEEFAADHQRWIDGMRVRIDLAEQTIAAAEAGDILEVQRLFAESESAQRQLLNSLTAPFVELITPADQLPLFANPGGRLTEEESAYVEALDAAFREFEMRAQQFGAAMRQLYPTVAGIFQALREAGAGEAVAAAQAAALAIEPPDSMADDHAIMLRYFEEAVRLDREIGESVERGDVAAFMIANVGLGRAAGLAVFDVHPAVCSVGFNALLCGGPGAVPDDEYLRGVHLTMRQLRIDFFPPNGPWSAFDLVPPASDEDLFGAVAIIGPDAIAALDNASGAIAALEPPDNLRGDHDALLAFLRETRETQVAIVDFAAAGEGAGMRVAIDDTETLFCESAQNVTEEFAPGVQVYFSVVPGQMEPPPTCR